jgi:hypothetical protein
MTNQESALCASAIEAIGDVDNFAEAGPLQPFKNLIGWIKANVSSVSKETLILAAEAAWDLIAKYNFQAIPDLIENEIKAFLRAQIRTVIEKLYLGS